MPNSFAKQSGSELRPERLWLAIGAAWIVAFTLAPFGFSFVPNEFPVRLEETFRLGDSVSPLKVAAHLSSFLAIGILVAAVYSEPNQKGRFVRLVIIGFIGCLLLETTQLLQSGRHARFTDLFLNAAGFSTGLCWAERTSFGQSVLHKLRAGQRQPLAQAVVAVCALAGWWIIGLQPALGGLRMNWDRSFPFAVGNEIGGARPWQGQLRYVGIYGRALSSADVRQLAISNDLGSRQNVGLLAGYDFRQKSIAEIQPYGEVKNPGLSLLVPPNREQSDVDGLSTSRPVVMRSRESATSLSDRIASSGSFSVEFFGKPANLLQTGPARLITISSGPAERNFTLGQSGADLVFRVRNQVNGSNGAKYELLAADVVTTDEQQIFATYDHGVSNLYKGGKIRSTVDLREPVFYSGLATGALARAALVCLAVITIGLPALFVFRLFFQPAAALLASVGFTFVAGILPYFVSCFVVGGPWRVSFIGWFLAALLLVYPLGLAFVFRSRSAAE